MKTYYRHGSGIGVILGFALSVFFNNYAVDLLGRETFLYTAYEYQKMVDGDVKTFVEIPFLLNMGFSFTITVITMVLISLAGPKINPNSFILDKTMFKLSPKLIAMVVFILLIISMLYVRFW